MPSMARRLTDAERREQVVRAIQAEEVSQRVIAAGIIRTSGVRFSGRVKVPAWKDPEFVRLWNLPIMMGVSVAGFLLYAFGYLITQ